MLIEPALLGLELSDERRRQVLVEKKELLERESKRIRAEIEGCESALKKLDGDEEKGREVGGMVATAAAALGGESG